MDRRSFLKVTAASAAASMIPMASAKGMVMENLSSDDAELSRHRIVAIRHTRVRMRWPRFVGFNAQRGPHGTGPHVNMCSLITDQGAEGLGILRGSTENANIAFEAIRGRSLSELFTISQGTLENRYMPFDFVFYDLAGVILNKPVYEMLGSEKPILCRVYSGMIYFDEMDPVENPRGWDRLLENCQWDFNYGYRQFKLKIGRGYRFMPKDKGLKADIEATRLVFDHFPDCDILVDANDGYANAEEFIEYLKGIKNVPLFWIEEPFVENRVDNTKLKQWLLANGRRNTLIADGETRPNLEYCLEMGKEQILDVYIENIRALSFSHYRRLVPRLQERGMLMSPHVWGDTISAYYASQLIAAYGTAPTLSGCTCFSDEIDLKGYRIIRGCVVPPKSPGFGMRLL